MTQQALAELVHVHVVQIRRYETGKSQPTLDVLRRMAKALAVSTDQLAFDDDERSPDDALRLQFEAASRLNPEEKKILMVIIEGILLQHENAQAASARAARLSRAS